MVNLPEVLANRDTILSVIWFFIGLGTGLALIRLWKYMLIALVVAFIAPFILGALGLNIPVTPERVLEAIRTGIEWFAGLLASNTYSVLGFLLGAAIGLVTTLLRRV